VQLEGKTALITGGTGGIGRATAVLFAREGAAVCIVDLNREAGEAVAREISSSGGRAIFECADVTRAADCRRAVHRTVEEFGGIYVLFNNAGIIRRASAVEISEEDWDAVMAVNVKSIFFMCREVIPLMARAGGGSIINLASVQGHACQRGVVAYAASKGAIHSLTRALALDHAADNIRVNSISPGSVRTPMLARSAAHFAPDVPAEEAFARFGAAHPLGRIGTPEEVAELAAFLASDKAGFCTGGDYLVDGGLLAGIGVQ